MQITSCQMPIINISDVQGNWNSTGANLKWTVLPKVRAIKDRLQSLQAKQIQLKLVGSRYRALLVNVVQFTSPNFSCTPVKCWVLVILPKTERS